jgi:hypothetical protein
MSPAPVVTWTGSLHLTFRLLPTDQQSRNLKPFLDAEGLSPEELLARLPYDRERSGDPASAGPDAKRYRDGKQVYQTAGLLYEDSGKVRITALGAATRRWLHIINAKNRVLLVRHAAYALAACQLRNPTGAGERYAAAVEVFPFAFIWRAMLALDGKISSDELNRGLFKVTNDDELTDAIKLIRMARASGDSGALGDEAVTGPRKNDRIIPWMSLASFGWTLFSDKRGAEDSDYYELDAHTLAVVKEAAKVQHRHRAFSSVPEYVEHLARSAALPKDLR